MSSSSFFIAVLGSYIAVNVYLLVRLFQTLAGTGALRFFASALLALLALAFPVSRFLPHDVPGPLAELLIYTGFLYVAPMLYAFMLTAAVDILRILNYAVKITKYPPPYAVGTRVKTVAAIVLLSLAVSLAGAYNATVPTARYLTLSLPAPRGSGGAERIRVVAFSDLHLGRFIGNRRLARVVALIERQKPDIVLLAGDTVEDLSWLTVPEERARAVSLLRSVGTGMGVWAVPGNHDYYAGLDRVTRFMDEAGITLMRDGWATPQGRLLLIGRDDPTVRRMEGRDRRSLREIWDDAARKLGPGIGVLPVIVLDHRPIEFEAAEDVGAALHLAGHAHRGQLFPVNFIVSTLYKKSYGAYRAGSTLHYISSGVGTWGPPVRTAGRPEIVVIDLQLGR